MSPSVSSGMSLGAPQASRIFEAISEFLIRRRILLSAIMFILLVAEDVMFGTKPHDLFDFRDPMTVTGLLLVVSGLAIRSWAVGILRKDAELTMTGPYRLIRNPLYVGSFLMMFGFCALIGDRENIFFVLGPVLLIYVVKVRHEEQLLSTRFAAQWSDYARTTPRFFPRLFPPFQKTSQPANWRLAQWLHSREYQAVGATLAALVAIKVWQSA